MKTSATHFIRHVNTLSHENPEALAHSLGIAVYEPFTINDTHDGMIVEIKPYGHYTFLDGSKVGLSYVGGSFYAYLAQDPLFKLAKKRYVHSSVYGRRKLPKVNTQQEVEPISPWGPMGSAIAFTTPTSH